MKQLVMRLTAGVAAEIIDLHPGEVVAGVSWYVWSPPEPERTELTLTDISMGAAY